MSSQMKGNIYLVGFMAAGKTTIGELLSHELGWKFIDLDRTVEERAGRSIVEIFRQDGEVAFRRLEKDALKEAATTRQSVIALGGGSFVDPENRGIALATGTCVFLDAPLEEIRKRIREHEGRPLAMRGSEELKKLLESRLPSYRRSNYRVDAVGKPDDVVQVILRELGHVVNAR